MRIEGITTCSQKGAKIVNLTKIACVPRSVYYYQQNTAKRKKKDALVLIEIQKLPELIQKTYGSKRMAKEFLSQGITYNHKRLARIRKIANICSMIRRRKFPKDYYKTIKENKVNIPQNILARNFSASKPMEKLVADITYFKSKEGWLYLNGILDLYNGEIVSYSLSKNINEALALDSVKHLCSTHSLRDTLLHTDQGSTYIGKNYRKQLQDLEIKQSMSRRGNCWDNACMEQFFGTLKSETIYLKTKDVLLSAKELVKMITEYIMFYNNKRIKKSLGWLSPVHFRELNA